jgi:hypothetical protein
MIELVFGKLAPEFGKILFVNARIRTGSRFKVQAVPVFHFD